MNSADWSANFQIDTTNQQAASDLWGTLGWGILVVLLIIILWQRSSHQ